MKSPDNKDVFLCCKVSVCGRTEYGEMLSLGQLASGCYVFYFKGQNNYQLPSFKFLKSNIIIALLSKNKLTPIFER